MKKFCSNCGSELKKNNDICLNCGIKNDYLINEQPENKSTGNGFSITGLVLGILSTILAIIALIIL